MRLAVCFKPWRMLAPSFGLVGSVVGLIGMLAGSGDSSVVMATVPIALTSTLYGIVFANFIFLPFSANIREKTHTGTFYSKAHHRGEHCYC